MLRGMREHPVRAILRIFFRRVVTIYFRDIEIVGDVPDRDTRGRLLAGNHMNGLVDPMLVMTSTPCVVSPVAKSTLWNIPGLKWLLDAAHAVPIVRRRDDPNKSAKDNDAVFERVAKHLRNDGNILIFPEGTSHNEPHLVALKSGAGRMIARARAEGGRKLTVQTVALEFDARDIFRSRVLVVFGQVRSVDELGKDGEALASAIMERIRLDLEDLLVEAPTWDDRLLIARIAAMFARENRIESLEEEYAIGRRVRQAERILRTGEPATLVKLRNAVSDYHRDLEKVGVTDEVVRLGILRPSPRRVVRGLFMLATAPLALLGTIAFYVPYLFPRLVTRRLKGDPDEASTYTIGVGLVVYPVWVAILSGLAFTLLPQPCAWASLAVLVVCPFVALPWLDRLDRLRAKLAAILPGRARAALPALAMKRRALMAILEEVRARVEPEPEP